LARSNAGPIFLSQSRAILMSWKPSKTQIEVIVSMGHGKAPLESIARAVGADPADITAFASKLIATRSLGPDALMPRPAQPVRAEPAPPQSAAERLFGTPEPEMN
jgi:hypothetical protein